MEAGMIVKLDPKDTAHRAVIAHELLQFMAGSYRPFYPGFEAWYRSKLIRGFHEGTRQVFVVRKRGVIAGVSVVRVARHPDERSKICSFFLLPGARGEGIGSKLLGLSLNVASGSLQTATVMTVPEERAVDTSFGRTFLQFLEEYGFRVIGVAPERYRAGKAEYILEASPTRTCRRCARAVDVASDERGGSGKGCWTNDAGAHQNDCSCGLMSPFREIPGSAVRSCVRIVMLGS